MADVAIEDASVSAGESFPVAAEDALLAEQQEDDIELGPLVRMRLSRTAANNNNPALSQQLSKR